MRRDGAYPAATQGLRRRYAHTETSPVRDERLHQHFGAVQVGTNLNNEAIDADLAHVYGKGVESYD